MKLSKLLDLDQSKEQSVLQDCFGDAYLFEKNSFYKFIRLKIFECGYAFSNELNKDFINLSLSQLENILIKKIIPYFDNKTILNKIENQIPGQTEWEEISENLKRNFIFHESCHAYVRGITEKLILQDELTKNQYFYFLLEESYANTCELLGILDVNTAVDRYFYEIHSYIFEWEEKNYIKTLVDEIGLQKTMEYFIVCFLYSHFLYQKIEDKDFLRLLIYLELESVPQKTQKSLKILSRIAFRLNPQFRLLTSRFYFRLNKIEMPLKPLQSIDVLNMLIQQPLMKKWFQSVAIPEEVLQ